MEETYLEHIVRRAPDAKSSVYKIAIVIICAILMYFVIILCQAIQGLLFLMPLMVAAVGWAGHKFYQNFNAEFEYILTDGELDIDKIAAKRRRKRLLNIKPGNFGLVAPYDEPNRRDFESGSYDMTLDVRSSPKAEGVWFIICTVKERGHVRVLFEPTDAMVDHLYRHMPSKVKRPAGYGR